MDLVCTEHLPCRAAEDDLDRVDAMSTGDRVKFRRIRRRSVIGESDRGEGTPMNGLQDTTERSSGSGVRTPARGVLGLLVVVAIGLAVALAGVPALFGGTALTVLSPSMVPTFAPGDVVVVRPRPVAGIVVGDVITFTARDPQTGSTRTVTHRVVGIDPGPVFHTRGDANEDPDPGTVAAADVRGVLWYTVPWVGGLAERLLTPAGAVIGLGVFALLVGALLLGGGRDRRAAG
jgi:signal peptidase